MKSLLFYLAMLSSAFGGENFEFINPYDVSKVSISCNVQETNAPITSVEIEINGYLFGGRSRTSTRSAKVHLIDDSGEVQKLSALANTDFFYTRYGSQHYFSLELSNESSIYVAATYYDVDGDSYDRFGGQFRTGTEKYNLVCIFK